MIHPESLSALSRDELIARAKALGAQRPELLTRVELCDEIIRLSEPDDARRKASRGWLGVARDLVASVVEAGLNMRDAAAVIRGESRVETAPQVRAPVATVTLAEIYAAQGHADRALSILDQVLASEPDHAAALALRDKLKREQPTASEKRQPTRDAVPEPEIPREETLPPPSEVRATQQESLEPAEPAVPAPPPEPEPAPEPVQAEPADADVSAVVFWEHASDIHLRWQAARSALARLEHSDPDGALVIRIVAYVPRREGAERSSRDLAVRSPRGSATVPSFGARAVVRAALGWSSTHGFVPFAVAAELDPTSKDEIKLLYEPPAGLDPRAIGVARAALAALYAA